MSYDNMSYNGCDTPTKANRSRCRRSHSVRYFEHNYLKLQKNKIHSIKRTYLLNGKRYMSLYNYTQ